MKSFVAGTAKYHRTEKTLAYDVLGSVWTQAMESAHMSTSRWMGFKMWYIYMVEFHSAIKENKPMHLEGKRMELENIIVTEVVWV